MSGSSRLGAADVERYRREGLVVAPEPLAESLLARMRASLDRSGKGRFDVKQGPGGVADIEFMVQYSVLRWAHQHPDLLDWTDNVRQLATLARHRLLEGDAADRLADAYRAFRAVIHRNALQELPALAPDDQLAGERAMVRELWRTLMGG